MLRKWRPSYKCLYVVGCLNGNLTSLDTILTRILPLRIFKNQRDEVVFLGNYLGGSQSADVIDRLIEIKEKYKERVIFIRGNQEEMCLRACSGEKGDLQSWNENNGLATIASYLNYGKIKSEASSISQSRLKDIIPRKHFQFLEQTEFYQTIDNYAFFHSGFDIKKELKDNYNSTFCFDINASKYIKDCVNDKILPEFKDDCVYIGAFNYKSDKPFIHSRYCMLGKEFDRIYLLELNSMEMCGLTTNKSRIYKHTFEFYE